MLETVKKKIFLVWALTKRDYAIQYAGSFLGLAWVFIQSLAFILLYLFILLGLGFQSGIRSSSVSFVLTGILFWLPVQELLIRGTVILTENRNLLKKTQLGVENFLQIPILQMVLHFGILSIPGYLVLFYLDELKTNLFFLSIIWFVFVSLLFYPVISYLGRANVLLRDISPIVRLFLQVLFWASPIIYYPPGSVINYLQYNPMFGLLEIFRFSVIKNYPFPEIHFSFYLWGLFFAFLLYLSRKFLHRLVLDQL